MEHWPLLLGRSGGIQDCSESMGQWGFTVAQGSVPRRLPSTWIQIWEMTKVSLTMGSLPAALGPQTRGTKLKAQSRDQKSGKGFLWTVALPERATVGEGRNPKITKLMKALWVELNNQVIIQILWLLCCCLQMRRKRTIEAASRDGQSL